MRCRPSYVSRQSGTEEISRATIATAPTMALDSSGSSVLRAVASRWPIIRELIGWVDAWRQCLSTLVPLLTICVKAKRNSSPLVETRYSNSYSLTSIEPALRKIRPCILTLRLNSFEL